MNNTLENIKGKSIKKLDIDLEKGGDFIYYEGVLLAHYFNKNNTQEHYFYDWCDTDKIINRWLLHKVNEQDLIAFLNKKMSSLELIQKNQSCYFIDIDANIEHKQILICDVKDIPKSYLPKETAYFDEDLYEEYAIELKQKLEKRLRKNLEKDTISKIKKVKTSLTNAFHLTQKDKKAQLEQEISSFLDGLYKKYANQ
jgi:hypothetical protein